MLRRTLCAVPRSSLAANVFIVSARFSSISNDKHIDHSASFSRPLTPEETADLDAMKNRTVPAFVPGKLFMRHWIAAEQSTVSIYNRAMSLLVTFGLILWAGVYGGASFQTESVFAAQLAVFMAVFLVLHTHMFQLYGVFLAGYAAILLLGY